MGFVGILPRVSHALRNSFLLFSPNCRVNTHWHEECLQRYKDNAQPPDRRTIMVTLTDSAIKVEPPIIAELRKLSPYWGENGPVTEPAKAFAPVYG